MAQSPPPAVAEPAAPAGPSQAAAPNSADGRSHRLAISRGQLLALLAMLLPAVASLLVPVLTSDISYQIASGQLMIDAGAIVRTDPFTFTVFGEPWLDQQWAAGVIFAAIFDATGWLGLLLLRSLLIGLAFGLVFVACRADGVSRIVAALVTLGAFAVAATNLALRSQLLGVAAFAAVMAILSWRRRYPLLLWFIPLLMVAWANTHGSFFVGWLALGLAALEDLVARRRLAVVTATVGFLSAAATLLQPFGPEMWRYVLELTSDPQIRSLVTEWQAPTLRDPTGIFFYASAALVIVLLLVRGRVLSWLQLAWLAGLALLALSASRNVVWWAIGAAPLVAVLVGGLEVRGRRLGDPAADEPRGLGYTAIAGLVVVLGILFIPAWRPSDPLFGPEGMVADAPRGVTETLLAEAETGEHLLAEQRWGSWFEQALPGVPVMVDTRIELFDADVWQDYLHLKAARADWEAILARWDVAWIALAAGDDQLGPFLDASPAWELRFADDEGAVYRRSVDED